MKQSSRYRYHLSGLMFVIGGVAAPSVFVPIVRADACDHYVLVESFTLPAGAGPFDTLGDGRVITVVADEVYVETAPGSRAFVLHGPLPGANLPSYGAAFLRVSPDGSRMAVGNNGGDENLPADFLVGVFDLDTLTGSWFAADHFDAAWIDDTFLAITAGDPRRDGRPPFRVTTPPP